MQANKGNLSVGRLQCLSADDEVARGAFALCITNEECELENLRSSSAVRLGLVVMEFALM